MPHYPRHLPAFEYIGFHRCFLTFCTHHRAPYFTKAESVALVLSQILRAGNPGGTAVTAYCFMPDHLHLLAEGIREDADLKVFMSRAKQLSGYHFKQATGERLWQRYGYERVLREEEATPEVIRYIIENPLRAGLITDVTSYPYWGSAVCSRDELIEHIQSVGVWAG